MRRKRHTSSTPPPSGARDRGLVSLSCPDCFGVLRFEREGLHGHLLYACQVRHRYSLGSLLRAKESHVERTLWSSALLLKQLLYAYEDLRSEMKGAFPGNRKRVQRRMNEVRMQYLAIQKMIEASHALE
jgi:hypothetical protein